MIKIPQLSMSLGLKSVVDAAAHSGSDPWMQLDSCYGRTPASSCKQPPPIPFSGTTVTFHTEASDSQPNGEGGGTHLGVSLVDATSPFLPVIPAALPCVEPPWVNSAPLRLCSGRAYGAIRARPWARKLLLPGAIFSVRVHCQKEVNVGMA